VFTDGLSYLGAGVGLSVGRRVTARLRLELGMGHGFGSAIRASNGVLDYRSRTSSTQATLGAGYDLAIGLGRVPLVARPGVRVGGRVIIEEADVGQATSRSTHLHPLVGPCLAIALRLGRMELGVDGEAFYVPTWPAAPSAGLYGFAAVAF
jgi:hypothetical protein